MALAVNRLIELEGGLVAAAGGALRAELPLPIAGLISAPPSAEVRERLRQLRRVVREMGCRLEAPFLQLVFLPLPVVPHLEISDRGLVDVDRFALIAASPGRAWRGRGGRGTPRRNRCRSRR